eukprot:745816-Hanusia_phi.AAC.1
MPGSVSEARTRELVPEPRRAAKPQKPATSRYFIRVAKLNGIQRRAAILATVTGPTVELLSRVRGRSLVERPIGSDRQGNSPGGFERGHAQVSALYVAPALIPTHCTLAL